MKLSLVNSLCFRVSVGTNLFRAGTMGTKCLKDTGEAIMFHCCENANVESIIKNHTNITQQF